MAALDQLTPGIWNVDPSHTVLHFTARHLMVAKVRGTFGEFSGVITIADDPLQSSVVASARAASIATNDDSRDAHLRSADFLDVDNHPTIDFRSTSIEPKGDDYVLHTDLTIRGVTRPVDFDLEFGGVGTDPWGNTRVGFAATAEINRKDWGLEWNVALEAGGVLVGEKVKIELDIGAVKA
jgi:polyisoprenoid-binding protein YceI